MLSFIERYAAESIELLRDFFQEEKNLLAVSRAAQMISGAIREGGKLLVFGNGGSAADSQHFAGEMVVRFRKDRQAFPCIALTCDTSILTAHSNDYGFESVYSRQLEALGKKGDVAFAISTSGTSPNVLHAAGTASAKGLHVIALTGPAGRLSDVADESIVIPSDSTAQIQQVHITVIHVLCDMIEQELGGRDEQ